MKAGRGPDMWASRTLRYTSKLNSRCCELGLGAILPRG